MKYEKDSLTFEQQADRLIGRGLQANRDELIRRLEAVSYYRFSGYLDNFRITDSENYEPGTTLTMIWRRYNFDRRLRMLLMDAIERIEVGVRTRFVYHFVQKYGPFGHLEKANLPNLKMRKHRKNFWQKVAKLLRLKGWEPCPHKEFLKKLRHEKNRASELFVKKFEEKYGDSHDHLPLWMACELMTCETTMQFAYGMEKDLFDKVASDFGFADQQLRSWMKAIFSIRNACAHHARLLNRYVGAKPLIPAKKREPLWREEPTFELDRVGLLLTVSYVWLSKISDTSNWRQRVFNLFNEYSDIPPSDLGMPDTWQTHPLWQ